MVRNYTRKTNRGETPRHVIEHGVNEVIFYGRSIRSVARGIGVSPMTLGRYVKQAEIRGSRDLRIGYWSPQRVFTDDQEKLLQDYIIRAANIYFGLTPKDVRILAYQCAVGVKLPEQWERDHCAGPDWFSGFLKRNPSLSIRTPEATSLSRATSFNRFNVARFFNQLEMVIERDNIKPHDIWNVDETGITTVQKPSSIVGPKGVKQIGALTSGERGTLVTMCAAVSATGNTVPPMFVFPRVKFYNHFIRDGPTGCIGASHPSGWMTTENFHSFIQHFAKIAKPSQEQKVLLLLDNHHSHIGLDTINFARENGIVMLSFPPHCSHKLQPLDRSVFGPFKKSVSSLQDSWMRSNPSRPMSIYDLPGIARDAWPRAATQVNITNGFKVSGIHPLEKDIFQDVDFAPAEVTDRPLPSSAPSSGSGESVSCGPGCHNSEPEDTNSAEIRQIPDDSLDSKLRHINREAVPVSGDGHCLLHAVAVGLAAEGIEMVPPSARHTSETLCTMLMSEVSNHTDHYMQFSNDRDIVDDMDRYVRLKEYNNETGDLILAALCNCLGISAIIYHQTAPGVTNILATGPGRPNVDFRGDIYLALKGENGNAHYSGVRKIRPETPNLPTFLPERIRPFPKAPPRKTKGGRKKRRSAVLTDTPEKTAIEEEHMRKTKNCKTDRNAKHQVKKTLTSKKQKKTEPKQKKKTSSSKAIADSSSDEEECFCLVCMEPYSNSRAREAWIQCQDCKNWSHEECTNVLKNNVYVCHNCDSEDEVDL